MDNSNLTVGQFFKVVVSGQAYLNLLYLFAAFPLSVFYSVFLISGLALGISLSIIWVGIPILLLMVAAWWVLASFERYMAVHILKEDIPDLDIPLNEDGEIWDRLKEHFGSPFTWKGLLYLFLKFPLGITSFVVVVVLVALTLAFLSMPFTYESLQFFQGGISFPGVPAWHIDTLSDALLGALIGLMLLPVTLHITNGLAWVHAKFARVMLSDDQMESLTTSVEV